jgi:hypothetical protein
MNEIIENENKCIAALIMVKNEELSIKKTFDSLKGYIDIVIVYDTGSTDNTISIIANTCKENGQILHMKTTTQFKGFSKSRNESIEFAETIDVKFLLLLDAGDEFKSDVSSKEFIKMISSIPTNFEYGLLKLRWLENNVITEHDDLRFIKNKSNIRYDLRYPVHETLIIQKANSITPFMNFYLYQNRDLYGESTTPRLKTDIQLLLNSEKCCRNFYYLAQTYWALGDIDNFYKYNLLALDFVDESIDELLIYSRIIYCILIQNLDQSLLLKYFNLAVQKSCYLIDIYLNVLRYCINNSIPDVIDPHLRKITLFDKINITHFSHEDLDYNRWHLISKYCLLMNTQLELGRNSCKLAVDAKNKSEDIDNLRLFENNIANHIESIHREDPIYIPRSNIFENNRNSKNSIDIKNSSQQHVFGVLIMVKNEEDSIKKTIESTKYFFDNIVVYDTGSNDNTIKIIEDTCKSNNQVLHLKKTDSFRGFPQSRNEAIEFAETVNVDFFLLMDAGDEFIINLTKEEMINCIRKIPSNIRFGLLKQNWDEGNSKIITHFDIRFIRNKSNCRYSFDYPVHEKFIMNISENPIEFGDMFVLYQNRELYGKKTNKRYSYDIQMLSNAKETPRNYFFLGQTYMDIQDFVNGYLYNKKALELVKNTNNSDNVDFETIITRLLYCAISCEMETEIIHKHFLEVIEFDKIDTSIDAYVYFLHYCIKKKLFDIALPLLEPLSKLKIVDGSRKTIRYDFYNYERWHLISVICFTTKEKMELGRLACQKAIDYSQKPEDIINIKLFEDYFKTLEPGKVFSTEIGFSRDNDSKSRIICIDFSSGFKNVVTHKDAEMRAIGASENQIFNLFKNVSKYKEIIYFKTNVFQRQKIDNISYIKIDEFLNFEMQENDIIIIYRYMSHQPHFLDKIKNHRVYFWVHDIFLVVNFTASVDVNSYYHQNPDHFKGYLSSFITNNKNIHFVFPSHFSKCDLIEFLSRYNEHVSENRLHVIHNILYENDFKNQKKVVAVDVNKIVFASSWLKNISSIIELFDFIHKQNKGYVLVFMEHGYERKMTYEIEMKERFGKNVEILGPQDKEKYAELIQSSLCVLISTFPETFGCVFTESCYFGTPVIADYRSGAVADHLDKDYVMNFDNPEKVFDKLEWLRQNRNKLDIKLDSKFMFDHNIKKWMKLLEIIE